MEVTVNLTVKIDKTEILPFESWMREQLEVISFKIMPETDVLYETDKTFYKLVKAVKKAQKERDIYINEKNY